MASYDVEVRFVGQFARWATDRQAAAWEILEIVKPGMIEDRDLEQYFGKLSGRFAAGEDLSDPDDVIDDTWRDIFDESEATFDLRNLAERVRNDWRAREQLRLLDLGVIEAGRAIGSPNGKAKHVAERLSMALLTLFADGSGNGAPQGLHEMLAAEREFMHAEDEVGVTLPYPKLEEACGPWIPGDVIALPAFSGSGKSTLAANLVLRWARRSVPVIAFPTEMRQRWLSRMLAADAGVRQWIAEKRQWKRASVDERDAYESAMLELDKRPLEIVNRSNISPAEVLSATRVLRKRWEGRTVVVVVDHMHRLNYASDEPNKAVGPATKLFKDFAENDRDGGIIFLLLYQPRKPTTDTYRPIAAHEIRGDSTVWNEIDVCLSPFRVWVKADELRLTPWGTPRAKYDPSGKPLVAKPESEGAKLSDEHVFIKIDKRRVGGEGPTIWLDYNGPSGAVFERDESWSTQ